MKAMWDACTPNVGAATYLYDPKMLTRLELAGLIFVARRFDDFDVYEATDAGRAAFARGTLPV